MIALSRSQGSGLSRPPPPPPCSQQFPVFLWAAGNTICPVRVAWRRCSWQLPEHRHLGRCFSPGASWWVEKGLEDATVSPSVTLGRQTLPATARPPDPSPHRAAARPHLPSLSFLPACGPRSVSLLRASLYHCLEGSPCWGLCTSQSCSEIWSVGLILSRSAAVGSVCW